MEVSQLRMLAEIWIKFDLNGSLQYKGETILSLLEKSLLSIASSEAWFELFEFASSLNLVNLREKCLQILESAKFSHLRTPKGRLQIKDKDFEFLLEYHHQR